MNPSYSVLSSQPARFAIALSGGPDSVALLVHASQTFDRKLINAIHINHGLRGAESDEDETFCKKLCEQLQVTLYTEKLAGESADENSLRDQRYARIAAYCAVQDIPFALTAHTQDDQIETLLFRLFRGTSPAGLSGIPHRRNLTDRLIVLRPLLNVRRAQVLEFLERNAITYRTDSSNLSNDYARNFIRNALLPQIKERFGDVIPRIENLRAQIQLEQEWFESIAANETNSLFSNGGGCSLANFNALPKALQRKIIAQQLRLRDIEVSVERVNAMASLIDNGGTITLSPDVQFVVDHGEITFTSPESSVELHDFELPLHDGINLCAKAGLAFDLKPMRMRPSQFPQATADEAYVDLSRISAPLTARPRRPGDVITPFGMHQDVKLKRYLQTHRDAAGKHSGFPVVIASGSDVLWVPGVGISEKIRVYENPTHHIQRIMLSADEIPFC